MEQYHFRLHHRRVSRCTKYVYPLGCQAICFLRYSSGGPRASFGMACASGVLLGVFEGVGVLMNRVFSEGTRAQLPPPRMKRLYSAYVLNADFSLSSIRRSVRLLPHLPSHPRHCMIDRLTSLCIIHTCPCFLMHLFPLLPYPCRDI
jgi:hypothetical protein